MARSAPRCVCWLESSSAWTPGIAGAHCRGKEPMMPIDTTVQPVKNYVLERWRSMDLKVLWHLCVRLLPAVYRGLAAAAPGGRDRGERTMMPHTVPDGWVMLLSGLWDASPHVCREVWGAYC